MVRFLRHSRASRPADRSGSGFPRPSGSGKPCWRSASYSTIGHRVGQVQAARVRAHRNADAAARNCPASSCSSKSPRLAAEHQKVVRRGIPRRSSRAGALVVAKCMRASGIFFAEGLPARMHLILHQLPVVQPRALQVFVRKLEAERLDEMQPRARGRAGAGDVARCSAEFRAEPVRCAS